jgi:hypothetical protein
MKRIDPNDREIIDMELALLKTQVEMMYRENEVKLKNLYALDELVNEQRVDLERFKKVFDSEV